MKIQKLTPAILLFSLSILFFTSCKKDDDTQNDLSNDSIEKNAEMDDTADNLDIMVEEGFLVDSDSNKSTLENPYFPDCVVRTGYVEDGVRYVTYEFDEDCEMPNGNIISGTLSLEYQFNFNELTHTIVYTFEDDFVFNGIDIDGGGTVVREMFGNNNNPTATFNSDITYTWPDGNSAQRVAERVREWVSGMGSGDWTDNEFHVTGNWTTTFSNGVVNTGEVTTALVRKMSCQYFVEGVITFTHDGYVSTLDFGDGTCDNEAIYTGPEGNSFTIYL